MTSSDHFTTKTCTGRQVMNASAGDQ